MALIVDERIIIPHSYSKEEMGRHRKQSTGNSDFNPVGILNEIYDILQSCKSQTDTDGIDDAIEILVIIFVISQQQP